MEQVLEHLARQLFAHLLEHSLFVLVGEFIVVVYCLLHYLRTLLIEPLEQPALTLHFEDLNGLIDFIKCLNL